MTSTSDTATRRDVLRTTGTTLAALGGTILAADSASARPSFQVTTHPASDVNTTYATLNGEILSLGGDANSATVWFEWGQLGTGMRNSTYQDIYLSATTFDVTINGLTPGVTYEFMATGENNLGWTNDGDVHTFTTPS